jgi:hypothetical protein
MVYMNVRLGPGDIFEVNPDASLMIEPEREKAAPMHDAEGPEEEQIDIVARMRAAIGLVDTMIDKVCTSIDRVTQPHSATLLVNPSWCGVIDGRWKSMNSRESWRQSPKL